jgi:hypothetical protein
MPEMRIPHSIFHYSLADSIRYEWSCSLKEGGDFESDSQLGRLAMVLSRVLVK